MEKSEGIEQIENAKWFRDNHGCANLFVQDNKGRRVWAYIQQRPAYCDRGHLQLNISGPLGLDRADSFPRYFFSFDEADKHTRTFLKWRLWKHGENEKAIPHIEETIDNPLRYNPFER